MTLFIPSSKGNGLFGWLFTNKKWEKKYGYKQTYVTMKGWKMRSNCNGEVEFIKDGE